MVFFLHIKSSPNLLFGVLCLPGDQSHPVAKPSINPLACCICWAGLLGRAVFPPWNEGPNSGSYTVNSFHIPWSRPFQRCCQAGWLLPSLQLLRRHVRPKLSTTCFTNVISSTFFQVEFLLSSDASMDLPANVYSLC